MNVTLANQIETLHNEYTCHIGWHVQFILELVHKGEYEKIEQIKETELKMGQSSSGVESLISDLSSYTELINQLYFKYLDEPRKNLFFRRKLSHEQYYFLRACGLELVDETNEYETYVALFPEHMG